MKLFIHATEHADLVWRRCFDRDFTYKGQNFISYADLEGYFIIENIKLCEQNDKFKFTIESVAMLKKFLEKHPDYETKICELFQKGQLQMPFSGDNIVDTNMVNGEGIIRNFLYGREYLKEKYQYIPYGIDRNDAFGNSAQLPQIARKFGTKWIFQLSYTFPDNLYWRGLDGSTVLTWMPKNTYPTGGYYKYRPCPVCNGFRDINCEACNNRRIDYDFTEAMRITLPDEIPPFDDEIPRRIYCGGEEILPSNHVLEWAEKNAHKYDIKFANYDDYIPYIEDLLLHVDCAGEDELHSSRELNCNNTGTFVTRINTKKTVRENENRLLSLETLAVLDMLKGNRYPKAQIEKIWEQYFFTIFHDSITATHIDAAYDEIMDYAKAIQENTEALKKNILSAHTIEKENMITVYNPYGSCVSKEVTVTIASKDDVRLADESGAYATITGYDRENDQITLTFLVEALPAFSKRNYTLETSDTPYITEVTTVCELNKSNGRPILTNEIFKDDSDGKAMETVIENERFRITAINQGIKEIFDKKIGKPITRQSEYMVGEWILEHDEGSPWATHSPDMRRQAMSGNTHLMSIEKTENTQKLTFMISPGLIDAYATNGLKIRYSVLLKKGGDTVDFEADVFWHTQNYRLRIAMPTVGESKHFYEIPYGVIEREPYEPDIVYPSGASNWASAAGDYPAINWAGIEKEDYSLVMLNRGTPSYQINQDNIGNSVIYLSVLRSPSIGSYLYSPSEYSMTDYDGMRDCGDHHFSYAIKAYETGFDQNDAVLDGVAYNAQLAVALGDIELPALPVLLCNDARITSIKQSQDQNGIIVRINEYHGKNTKGTLVLPANIEAKAIYETDLKEDKVKELSVKAGEVELDISYFEIKTVYIVL